MMQKLLLVFIKQKIYKLSTVKYKTDDRVQSSYKGARLSTSYKDARVQSSHTLSTTI